jgi:AmmeMemoRadiSam system protein A
MPFPSEADRQALLRFARQVVVEAVTFERLPDKIPNDGIFAERRGVFVTLRKNARLCGCIGVIHADAPLGDSIARCAARQDPRFGPMGIADLSHFQVEISLMSPPEPIDVPRDVAQIEIGRHGLIVASGDSRGLLLPQVATEHRFTRERFLSETCRKARLLPDAWRDPGTQVLAFTCDVFSDEDPVSADAERSNARDPKNKNPRDVASRGPEKSSFA